MKTASRGIVLTTFALVLAEINWNLFSSVLLKAFNTSNTALIAFAWPIISPPEWPPLNPEAEIVNWLVKVLSIATGLALPSASLPLNWYQMYLIPPEDFVMSPKK